MSPSQVWLRLAYRGHASMRTDKIATVDSRFATALGQLQMQDRALVTQHLRSLLQDVLIA
jgi:hypothetical protein